MENDIFSDAQKTKPSGIETIESAKDSETAEKPETIETIKTPEMPNTTEAAETSKKTGTRGSGKGIAVVALILSIITLSLTLFNTWVALVVSSDLSYKSGIGTYTFAPDSNSANFTEGSIADVANSVSPSVVSIITETKTRSYSFFYGETESTGGAAGTGIIVSADGYILTNKHVISGAEKVWVVLDDGTTLSDVSIVATDPLNDVAFLKIANAPTLPAATLGDSKTITVGQQVIAIGIALGQYQNSVTSGIISGAGRSLVATDSSYQNAESLTDMIQTDAAINSGNSGGPLVNAAGEVIGINTAVSEGNGLGFAIPISSIKGMLKSLLTAGSATRAYAGVAYSTIDAATALEENLPVNFGAYVSEVVKNSPADSAGLKKADIIIAVDGIKLGANCSLGTLLGEHSAGDTVTLTVVRDGSEKTFSLTLAAYSE